MDLSDLGPVAQNLKIKRKSPKSNASQKKSNASQKKFMFDFFSVAQKVMFDIKRKYQTQLYALIEIKHKLMPWLGLIEINENPHKPG